jgi:carboxypeptidase C (cathepsin A)
MIKGKQKRTGVYSLARIASANLLAALILAACGGGGDGQQFAQTQPAQPVAAQPVATLPITSPPVDSGPVTPPDAPFLVTKVSDTITYDSTGEGSLKKSDAIEQSAASQHDVMVDGKQFRYVSTAGHLNVADPETPNDPTARMFYVAYTAKSKTAAPRPVTFFYNGGPGSSSIWLHLGSFGPKRTVVDAPNIYSEANKDGTPPQFPMVDNAETLLATTDLVFVDAIATGYSQAIEPKKNIDFWNTDADAAVFRNFVMRYIVQNNRQSSPFYLAGESYGGPRTAILSKLLAQQGYLADGIVLISPILNYNSNCSKDSSSSGERYFISCAGFVPTYAATIAHHFPQFLPQGMTLSEYIEGDVVSYVSNTYAPAVQTYIDATKKHKSIPAEMQAEKMAAKAKLDSATAKMETISTEMKAKYGVEIKRSRGLTYNPTPRRFYEVNGTLKDMELGRYDSRIAVPSTSRWAEEGDPASTLLGESYLTNIKEVLDSGLGFSALSGYTLRANDSWSFTHSVEDLPRAGPVNEVDSVPDIKIALKLNPKMKIFAASGYADMATAFHLTKLDLDRLTGAERANLTIKNYEGGHMMYLTNSSRIKMKSDLEKFYRSASSIQ